MADDTLIFDTQLDTSGLSTGLGKIGNVAGTAFKGMAVAVGAATTAVGALSKSAVDSYADYEQLVGGVETLFKDSAKTVKGYADLAYQSAGLSANEYMETVTSFSASLLQSLGGDTAKSAELANQTIIDMSDNANKMGTDMEAIQNAYNGFSKQNYTMLDNLKLGYGGTKEEMQRLLDDAEKLSGIKYDISSFGDVTQAIHVMQESMGIAGTTAKEASTTISGSIQSMKSQWQNLLIAIANGNDWDVDVYVSNFVSTIETALNNLIPVIEKSLVGISEMVVSLAPTISEKLPELFDQVLPPLIDAVVVLIQALATALPDLLTTILDILPSLMTQLITVIMDLLPQLIEVGMQAIVQLALGIADALPELIPALVDTVLMIVDTLIDNIDMLIDAAIAIIMALADGLIKSLPKLIAKAPEIISKLVDAIVRNAPKLLEAGLQLIQELAKALITYVPQLLAKVPEIVVKLVKGFVELRSKFTEVGKNIIDGIWDGLKGGWDWLVGKVGDLAKSLLSSAKKVLGIASPSKQFRYLGEMCVAGMDEPIEDYNPYETMEASFKASAGSLQASFAGGTSGFSLDYTGIGEQVANAISGMAVTIDGRTAGALLAEPVNNALGVLNGRRY